MDFRKRIGENIDEVIRNSGKTKSLIAEKLGVKLSTIICYTKGRAVPSLESFYELCQILGCSYSDILD